MTTQTPPQDTHLPPFDAEAEAAVIASCLVDDTAFAQLSGLVAADDFFREKHSVVFAAMQAVAARGEPTGPILVANELASRGQLDGIGGLAHLVQLTTELPTAVGCVFYASIVRRDATFRRLISAGSKIVQLGYQGGPQLQETLATAQALVTLAQRQTPGRGWRTIGQSIADGRAELEAWADNPRQHSRGIPTGLAALDRLLLGRGLLPGKTYVLGAATSIGKSTFLRIVLRNVALAGQHAGLLTLEQDEAEVREELAFGLAGIDRHWHESTGEPLDDAERADFLAALDRLQTTHTLHVDDCPALTPAEACQRMSRLVSQHEVRVIGIDYLNLLDLSSGRKGVTAEQEISDGLRLLRDAAKRLNVALIVLSQLNHELVRPERARNEFRPTKRDFRGSGAVTYLAFAVLALHRRDYFVQEGLLEAKGYQLAGNPVPKGTPHALPLLDHELSVHVLKQQRGPRGTATLRWDGARSTVADLDGAS